MTDPTTPKPNLCPACGSIVKQDGLVWCKYEAQWLCTSCADVWEQIMGEDESEATE
jgi:hypothetical protein